jgi:hypothetical protein
MYVPAGSGTLPVPPSMVNADELMGEDGTVASRTSFLEDSVVVWLGVRTGTEYDVDDENQTLGSFSLRSAILDLKARPFFLLCRVVVMMNRAY